ncbi:MAG: carboxypeptidase-like regulatory domain-containing protein [bacterium]
MRENEDTRGPFVDRACRRRTIVVGRLSLLMALLALVLVLIPALAGQTAQAAGSTVSGQTLDSASGLPLEGVNVFLAHTTYGTSSDRDGGFAIRDVAEGSYTLVCSKVGYAPEMAVVELPRPDSVYVEMRLAVRPIALSEVRVTARSPDEWTRQLRDFVRAFLGRRDNADGARILNPEVLDFHVDPATGMLVAETDSMLRVENRSLGYRVDIVLVSFSWSSKLDAGTIVLYPRFTPLDGRDDRERRKWAENRRRTFQGSMTHFLSAAVAGRAGEEGFVVRSGGIPVPESALGFASVPGTPLTQWMFDDRLRVEYRGGFLDKVSYIVLREERAVIDSLGFLVTPLCFDVSGEWARYRVADMLPRQPR